jgi:hypothetical protein
MKILRLFYLLMFAGFTASRACDLCGCYAPQLNTMAEMGLMNAKWYAAVAEQFTRFGTLQFDGDEIHNPLGRSTARLRSLSLVTNSPIGSPFS